MELVLACLLPAALASLAAPRSEVPCGSMALAFDAVTGQWCGWSENGRELLSASARPDLTVAGPDLAWPAPEAWQADAPEAVAEQGMYRVSVRRRAGAWTITSRFGVYPAERRLVRSLTLHWDGAATLRTHQVSLRVPGLDLGDPQGAVGCLPGAYPPREFALSADGPSRADLEPGWTWSDTGCAYVRSDAAGLSVVGAYQLMDDRARVGLETGEGGPALVHHFEVLARLTPGSEIAVGSQYLQLAGPDLPSVRQAGAQLSDSVNQGPPPDRPEWLDGAVLYEVHPWGRLEAWGAGDRGNRFPSLEAQLPYLKDLGVSALWLLPVTEKPPWVYYLPRLREIDPEVGTMAELASMVRAGHDLGIRTLMDIVTYGVAPDNPDAAHLPDAVWCLDEKGERVRVWGGTVVAADCSNPDWNAHIADLGAYWVREAGCDGYRLDCGGAGQTPNYSPEAGPKANRAILAGGVQQNARLRGAIRAINPDAVLLPEAGATCNFPSADMLFDYPFYMACRELTREPDTGLAVTRLREWLAGQQITHSLRQQLSMVRFLELHDTVSAQEFFGLGPSQALTALSAFVPGVLLLQQEQEVGMAEELRQWLKLRRELPELRTGEADYTGVTVDDPRVLAFSRRSADGASIVLVSFAPVALSCHVRWPEELAEAFPAVGSADMLAARRESNGIGALLPPYRPVVIALRHGADGLPLWTRSDRAGPEAAPHLEVARQTERTADGLERHTLRVAGATEWFVLTTEGYAIDQFVDRSRGTKPGETHVDAVPPLARLWRPLENRLWDGPGEVGFGLADAHGKALWLRVTDRDALRAARVGADSPAGSDVSLVIDAVAGTGPFEIAETTRADLLSIARDAQPAASRARVEVDPLFVRISNGHYTASLARRHGGVLAGLRTREGGELLAGMADVYTDWGLFDKGVRIASEWETSPRMTVSQADGGAEVTFEGSLRRPSWNGVAAGGVADPAVRYTLTYRADESATLQVTLGIRPTTDRPDTSAFYALRIPFTGADWSVSGTPEELSGAVGAQPGQRVYQAREVGTGRGAARMRLAGDAGTVTLSEDGIAQNPFLLDGGPSTIHLFFALLDGQPVNLTVGSELAASARIEVEP